MVTSVDRHGKARHFALSVLNPRPLSQALRHSLELLATLMEDRREPFEDALEEQPAARGRSNMTTINLNGYQYTRAWSSQKKISYRCSVYRGTGCAGKVDFLASTRQFENFVEHSCRCHADPAPPQVDIRVLMQTEVDRLALANLATPALQIWDMVDAQFYRGATDQALRGLTQQQVTGRVYRTRALHFGGNIHGHIEVPPLSSARPGPQLFPVPLHQRAEHTGCSEPNRWLGASPSYRALEVRGDDSVRGRDVPVRAKGVQAVCCCHVA
jgi:hypothetical protein